VAVKSIGDISAEPVRGQKIEEHVVTDIDVRNDDSRPSLTSGTAADERQDVSSINTIDEQNGRQKVVNRGLYVCVWGALRSCRGGLTFKFDKNSTNL